MTNAQINLAFAEAINYTDVDAFAGDILLTSEFLPLDNETASERIHINLRRIFIWSY